MRHADVRVDGMVLARLNSRAREAEILRLLPALHVHLRSPQRSKAVTPLPGRVHPIDADEREMGMHACVRACACVRARAYACECVRVRACVRYVSVHVHAGACNQAGAFTNMRARAHDVTSCTASLNTAE
jgi:hypothetical protein